MSADKNYRCKNPLCPLGESREAITIDGSGQFSCESGRYYSCPQKHVVGKCRAEHLEEQEPEKSKVPWPLVGGGIVGVVVIAVIVAMVFSGEDSLPEKEKKIAEELQQIWPWLGK